MSAGLDEDRLDRNRRNAAASTGPRSMAGKARAARNATKHGLSAHGPDAISEEASHADAAAAAFEQFDRAERQALAILADLSAALSRASVADGSGQSDEIGQTLIRLQRLERYRHPRLLRWLKSVAEDRSAEPASADGPPASR